MKTLLCGATLIISFVLCTFGFSFGHSWMAPKEAAEMENPIEPSQQAISDGKEIFLDNCAVCHGNKAQGLSRKVTNLAYDTPNLIKSLKSHSEGDFFWKIINGREDMPSFKEDLTEDEIWQVIHFLKSHK